MTLRSPTQSAALNDHREREGGRGRRGVCGGGHSRGKENCIIFDPEPFTV